MAFMKQANRAYGTLLAGISDAALSFTLNAGEGDRFPAVGNFYAAIFKLATPDVNREIVLCTARSSNTFTIDAAGRGQQGTTPVAHSAGDRVERTWTKGDVDAIEAEINLKMNTADDAAAAVTAMGAKGDANPLNHDKYVHPNHSGDVTSTADGAQALVATPSVNAIALAAAVTNAIADGQMKAPDGNTVFHALAAKGPRAAAWVFAASDSSALDQAQADRVVSATPATARAEIQADIDAIGAAKTLLFLPGTYSIAETGSSGYGLIITDHGMVLEGCGDGTILTFGTNPGTAQTPLVNFYDVIGCKIRNMKMTGGASTGWYGEAIKMTRNCRDTEISDIWFDDWDGYVIEGGASTIYRNYRPHIHDCRFSKCYVGMYLRRTLDAHIHDFSMWNMGMWGVYMETDAHGTPPCTGFDIHDFNINMGRPAERGSHTGANDASVMSDSTKSWPANSLVGYVITNVTDGSTGTITANAYDASGNASITATLSGGTDNNWDTGDIYWINSWVTGVTTHLDAAITATDASCTVDSTASFVGATPWVFFPGATVAEDEYRQCVKTNATTLTPSRVFSYDHPNGAVIVEIQRCEHGMYLQGSNNKLHDGEIRNAVGWGIRASCDYDANYDNRGDWTVHNLKVHDCLGGGIYFGGPGDAHNIQIHDNTIFNCASPRSWYAVLAYQCAGMMLEHDRGEPTGDPEHHYQQHIIHDNLIRFVTSYAVSTGFTSRKGIFLYGPSYCDVHDNIIIGTGAGLTNEYGIHCTEIGSYPANNSVIHHNQFYGLDRNVYDHTTPAIAENAIDTNIEGCASTATAAGTTTLDAYSWRIQRFTGSTTQTVVMPVTSTLTIGRQFHIFNRSTGVVTVQSSGGNTICALASGESVILTCINLATATDAGWDAFNLIPAVDDTAGGTDGATTVPASSNALFDGLAGKSYIPIAAAGGTVDAITADYTPNVSLADRTVCMVVAAGANTTTTPTFAPDGLTAHTIVKQGGAALVAGDIVAAGMVCILEYNLANTRWELLNPKGSAYTHPNHSGDVTSVADGAQTLVATAGVNAIALAAAVHSGAIDDDGTLAPTHDAVFHALAAKLDLAGGTMTGNINLGDELIYGAYHDYGHGATQTLDPATDGRLLKHTVDDATAFTITDPGVCCTFELWMVKDASETSRTPTWALSGGSVKWLSPTGAPVLTTNGGNYYATFKRMTSTLIFGEWAEFA